jgi:hypothetical protein
MPQLLQAHSCWCALLLPLEVVTVQTFSQRVGLLCHQLPPASIPQGSFAAAEGGRVMWRSLEHSLQGASSTSCAMRSALQQTTSRQQDSQHLQYCNIAQCGARHVCLWCVSVGACAAQAASLLVMRHMSMLTAAQPCCAVLRNTRDEHCLHGQCTCAAAQSAQPQCTAALCHTSLLVLASVTPQHKHTLITSRVLCPRTLLCCALLTDL